MFLQLVVGLDYAGKTTLVSALQRQGGDTHPTIGFSKPICIKHKRQRLKLYDVGGGRGIRAIWGQYLPEVHGIIFVVDASMRKRMAEAAEEFSTMLQNECARNKHILVLANKQDQPEALPPDLVDAELPLHALPFSLCAPFHLEFAHFLVSICFCQSLLSALPLVISFSEQFCFLVVNVLGLLVYSRF